jgi:hypothetical protein
MLQLGQKAKDKISGIEGILTGRASYITGCDQYLIQPECIKGDYKEGRWVDEGRIEIIGKGIKIESVKVKDNGGPACNAPKK